MVGMGWVEGGLILVRLGWSNPGLEYRLGLGH